jgi:hypothetical protein
MMCTNELRPERAGKLVAFQWDKANFEILLRLLIVIYVKYLQCWMEVYYLPTFPLLCL